MSAEIHTWWPRLSVEAKHALREHPGAVIPAEVRVEIGEITGGTVEEGARLSDDEVQFIETQREQVD
ncbi:hypothetical protein GCM10010915_19890 [Microbacterium faecale]|uniref:Uncharacterized protein n=1 Tax=Microbacterium faecale TaxID=1804630 RepID=A0A916YCM5_9MICO|nr:hypothetical protein [Microbacterium faecale]GGD39172.1 hypothetical protein GCM10010915_19890 [Microbacterium faecale]